MQALEVMTAVLRGHAIAKNCALKERLSHA
jgi:hypothetical protein